jgi:hypothetical protein
MKLVTPSRWCERRAVPPARRSTPSRAPAELVVRRLQGAAIRRPARGESRTATQSSRITVTRRTNARSSRLAIRAPCSATSATNHRAGTLALRSAFDSQRNGTMPHTGLSPPSRRRRTTKGGGPCGPPPSCVVSRSMAFVIPSVPRGGVRRAVLPARRSTPSRDRARVRRPTAAAGAAAAAARRPGSARSGSSRTRCPPG